ncbi:MAG TPA: cohesin domain-containing protein, partial [Membranihabitans sp.]|nr:cohesin domain-containing protein [Membranihabitans sp.]
MIRYFTCIVFLLTLITGVSAQPEFTLTDAQGNTGDVVSIDVKVKDFEAIVGFQFAVKFDPAKLKIVSVKNLTTAIDEFDNQNIDYSAVNANAGLITVAYANATSDNGFSIADNGVFFTLEFEIVATGNTTATVDIPQEVDFGEFSRKVEMINNQFEEIGMTAQAGTVTIGEGGSGPGRVSLTLGTASGSQGETVCVPITVNNFTDIIGMQYSIKFDTDFMDFVEGKDFNLANFSNASISTESVESDKALIVSWNTPSSDPITVSDGTI